MENVVRVLSTLALMGAVRNLASRFEAETAIHIEADFAPTIGLLDRLRGGEAADIVILTAKIIADLAGENLVGKASISDVGLVETALAAAVRPDWAPRTPPERREWHRRSDPRGFYPPYHVEDPGTWQRNEGYTDNPADAETEAGGRYLAAISDAVAGAIVDFHRNTSGAAPYPAPRPGGPHE